MDEKINEQSLFGRYIEGEQQMTPEVVSATALDESTLPTNVTATKSLFEAIANENVWPEPTTEAVAASAAEKFEVSEVKAVNKKAKKNKKKTTFGDVLLTVLFIGFVGAFLYAGWVMLNHFVVEPAIYNADLSEYKNVYDSTQHADGYEQPRNPDGTLQSFDALRAKNSDVIGWVTVPGTIIDYPVVKYKDNDFYLHHDINKAANANGTIFAHWKTMLAYGEKTPITVIFGHHMQSGIMFENLMKYCPFVNGQNAIDFYHENPVITYNTIYEEGQWIIFGIMKINGNNSSEFDFIRSSFEDEDDCLDFIRELRERSLIDTNKQITVTPDDELLLMSTCSYEYDNYRTVVYARKLHKGEKIDVSGVTRAAAPVFPSGWYKKW